MHPAMRPAKKLASLLAVCKWGLRFSIRPRVLMRRTRVLISNQSEGRNDSWTVKAVVSAFGFERREWSRAAVRASAGRLGHSSQGLRLETEQLANHIQPVRLRIVETQN